MVVVVVFQRGLHRSRYFSRPVSGSPRRSDRTMTLAIDGCICGQASLPRRDQDPSRVRICRGIAEAPGRGENLRGQGVTTPSDALKRRKMALLARFLVVDSVESVPRPTGTPQLPSFSFIGCDTSSNSESYYPLRKQNIQCCCLYNAPLSSVSMVFVTLTTPLLALLLRYLLAL
jgi:hypothetical protein